MALIREDDNDAKRRLARVIRRVTHGDVSLEVAIREALPRGIAHIERRIYLKHALLHDVQEALKSVPEKPPLKKK